MERTIKASCDMFHADYEITFTRGYPTLVNHPQETEFVANIAKQVPGIKEVTETPPIMGGEDFSYYLQHVNGAFFFTGASNSSWAMAYPHHHPKFDIDERALLHAAKILGAATLQYMD
ncbi:M20/M25/M40 family metallo-hydrolase [Virgibacillus dokdonensis]|uniref:M20/M25/M40 family metallo-hydrolase n=1 Tax=Virgibacillus dokdonensis TaxID=302167 RepID=A0A2K9J151_9BACI|nr:M20/M25/M40 family metallo-hydrolase [Virgibacillus dokdonensis]AUJ25616.1 N-acetyldiaminopimelate deacetylase [Virgibacillus dokdonensis]